MPILNEIVAATRASVAQRKREADLRGLEEEAAKHAARGFRHSLELKAAIDGVAIIAELKKASPSKGVLRAHMDVPLVASQYEIAGAAALSVLTEERYFQGSLENLRLASAATQLPCLRKDFIVDEFQLVEAGAYYADAVLLIVAALSDPELRTLYTRARALGLDVLCEVHDETELARAIDTGCDIIGVNNRDLRTFQVNLATAERLAARMPAGVLKVAESGIHTGQDIAQLLAAGFTTFLVGESLITKESPGQALRELFASAQNAVSTRQLIAESRHLQ